MSTTQESVDDLMGKCFSGGSGPERMVDGTTKKLDENGVLSFKIPYTSEWDYFPIFVARYALYNLGSFLKTRDESYKAAFFTQVEWLRNNMVEKGNFAVWEHHYTLPYYTFNRIPWVQGLGQGLGMVAFLKAYQLTNEEDYMDKAKKVLHSFAVDIKDGGARYVDENGYVWYEEYALDPPPKVLNGFITILFSMWEMHRVTGDKEAGELFEAGLETLKKNLPCYDAGYWSFYEMEKKLPSTPGYHNMHVRQLHILHEITGEEMFMEYHKKWGGYQKSFVKNKRAALGRGVFLLRKHGIKGSVKRYRESVKWKKS